LFYLIYKVSFGVLHNVIAMSDSSPMVNYNLLR
jgi:hypothetical protein